MNICKRHGITRALAMTFLLAPLAAGADVYIGAGVYESEASVEALDDNDTTSGFQLGTVFIDSVVIVSGEIGSYDLGSYDGNNVEVDGDALTLGAVVSLALGPFFEIYAKAGIADVDIEINGSSEDGTENYTGIGFSIDILDTLDIYVEMLDFDTEADSELLGAGVRLQF